MRGYSLPCLVAASLVALAAGLNVALPRPQVPIGISLPSCNHRTVVANANKLFGVDLYKKVKAGSGSNSIILSPFSVSTALAMTYAGAYGATRSQMRSALRFDTIPFYCGVNEGFRQLLNAFSSTHFNHSLSVANRLFVERRFSILRSYRHVTSHYYGAGAMSLPFSRTQQVFFRNPYSISDPDVSLSQRPAYPELFASYPHVECFCTFLIFLLVCPELTVIPSNAPK
ncbi:Leukocyte elastase inhibitor [Lamellibrachia satsuma]|nr:Leukocyte elastase inhibitor [Lamellibrachia satsuma]